MGKRKPEQQPAAFEAIGAPIARDLDDGHAVVAIKRTVGHVAALAFHLGDAKHQDGRTAEVLGALPGGILVTVTRAGAEPFVATFTTEALVRAAFAAEEAHRAPEDTAPAAPLSPEEMNTRTARGALREAASEGGFVPSTDHGARVARGLAAVGYVIASHERPLYATHTRAVYRATEAGRAALARLDAEQAASANEVRG
ncbi:MAG: hypothetical protein U0324_46195 [Polyangiales bacterium]